MDKKCTICHLSIQGQFVRTAHGMFHTTCFQCAECGISVVQKFFPLAGEGDLQLFCEQHYFARLGLLCHVCNTALRGPFISAAGHKYHVEHFKCSTVDCGRVFQQDDCYYERDGNVYCGPHYAITHANRCQGCGCAILKTFVKAGHEGDNTSSYEWHPPCYVLSRQWHIELLKIEGYSLASEANPEKFETLSKLITGTVHRLLQSISQFEETSAESVTEMLVTIAGVAHDNSVTQAAQFNRHIVYFFDCIEELDGQLIAFSPEPCLNARDPKRLVRQIMDFYNVLMGVRDPAGRAAYTRQLITLVSNLAQTLKSVIRGALLGALRLELVYGKDLVMQHLTEHLEAFQPKDTEMDVTAAHDCLVQPPKSHLCSYCNNPLEEACLVNSEENLRWHHSCFRCGVCAIDIPLAEAALVEGSLKCLSHSSDLDRIRVLNVSAYHQYQHLLSCALQRLCKALDLTTQSFLNNPDGENEEGDEARPMETEVPPSDMSGIAEDRVDEKLEESHPTSPVIPWGTEAEGYYRGVNIAGLPKPDIRFGDDQVILTDISGLQMLSLRQLFALAIHRESGEAFPLSMLLDIGDCGIADKKNVFSRMLNRFNKKKKKPLEGLFGIPLEDAVEAYGVRSDFGLGGKVRVPIFIDHIVRQLQKMGFIWQGVFRESGNAGRINKLKALVNNDPRGTSFLNLERADHWDFTVLFKKYFIDLPVPLLTFKLYPLFVWADSLPDLSQRLSALRMVVSMLPKANLDLFSVVVRLMNEVAFFSFGADGTGNKMTLENLGVVMGGCLLYTKELDLVAAKSAARCLQTIFSNYREIFSVPESSLSALHDPADVNTQTDLIRKYEQVATDLRRMETGDVPEGNIGHIEEH